MKNIRTTIIAAAAALLGAAACSTVSIEERMAGFFEFCNTDTAVEEAATKLNRVCPDRPAGSQGAEDIIDYFMLQGSKTVKNRHIKTIDVPGAGRDIMIDIPGKKRRNKNIVLVAAPADTWTEEVTTVNAEGDTVILDVKKDNAVACAAAFEIVRAFKETKVKPDCKIRILIYQDNGGKHEGIHQYADYTIKHGENHLLQLYLTSDPNGSKKTFTIGEPREIYTKFVEVITPYFEKYDYKFDRGESTSPEDWAVKSPFYTFNVDPSNPAPDIAAAASIITMLD